MHDSPTGGHFGMDATLKKVKGLFHWQGMTRTLQHFIKLCIFCQSSKYDNNSYLRLLQPSQIPNEVWMDVSMDVIEGLPKSFGKEVIW